MSPPAGFLQDGTLRVDTRLQPSHGEWVRRDDTVCEVAQCRSQRFVLRVSQPVGVCEVGGSVDRDRHRVAIGEEKSQGLPLIRLLGRVPRGLEEVTHVITGDGEPVQTGFRAVKDEDRASSGREPVGRDHRHGDGIVRVFTARDDPAVDAVLVHESREKLIESPQRQLITTSGCLT